MGMCWLLMAAGWADENLQRKGREGVLKGTQSKIFLRVPLRKPLRPLR